MQHYNVLWVAVLLLVVSPSSVRSSSGSTSTFILDNSQSVVTIPSACLTHIPWQISIEFPYRITRFAVEDDVSVVVTATPTGGAVVRHKESMGTTTSGHGGGGAAETAASGEGQPIKLFDQTLVMQHNGQSTYVLSPLVLETRGVYSLQIVVSVGNQTTVLDSLDGAIRAVPGWLSITPPLLCIIIAIGFKQVLLSLLSGMLLGCFYLHNYNPVAAVTHSLADYWVEALGNPGNAGVVLLMFLLGGLIGVVTKSGGALGLAAILRRYVTKTQFSTKIALFVLGCCLFFDDYSSVLIAGSTMRTIVDSMKISKAKFAFLIHAMGTALASFAPISSWVGVEIGYITNEYTLLGNSENPFIVFISSIPYRFFPLCLIMFLLLSTFTGRDFGPMWLYERDALAPKDDVFGLIAQAEKDGTPVREHPTLEAPKRVLSLGTVGVVPPSRTRSLGYGSLNNDLSLMGEGGSHTAHDQMDGMGVVGKRGEEEEEEKALEEDGPLDPKPGMPRRWFNAALPFGLVIIVTVVGMYLDGKEVVLNLIADGEPIQPDIVMIFAHANVISALLWSSFVGVLTAALLVMPQRILNIDEVMEAFVNGIKEVVYPILILTLAWSFGNVVRQMQTADYIVNLLGDGFPGGILPFLVGCCAYAISFAIGSSFATMGILFPLVVPIAIAVKSTSPNNLLQSVSAIFGGCIFGDCSSPIADNTILTCLASKCDVDIHVRTQLPYIILVSVVSIVFGNLFVGLELYPVWVAYIIAAVVMTGALMVLGKRTDTGLDMAKLTGETSEPAELPRATPAARGTAREDGGASSSLLVK